MIPKNRAPSTPGEILREEFLVPMKMTQAALAEKMGVPIQRVNLILNDKRAITAETALLLAKAFEASPQFWLNLQNNYDLWIAQQKLERGGRSA